MPPLRIARLPSLELWASRHPPLRAYSSRIATPATASTPLRALHSIPALTVTTNPLPTPPSILRSLRRSFASTAHLLADNPTASKPPSSPPPSISVEPPASDAVSQVAEKPVKLEKGEVMRLISLAKPERKTIAYAIVMLVVSSSISLSIPFTIGRVIDFFSNQDQTLPISVPAAATLLGCVFGIGALAAMGRVILMRLAGQRIVARLRESAYTNVLRQDIGWHDLKGASAASLSGGSASTVVTKDGAGGVRSTGDVISRLGSDAGIVGDSLTRELSDGLRALVTATVGIGAMFMISAKLTTVMLSIVPPISIAAVFYGRFLKKLSRETQKAVGEMVAVSEERLGAIRTVHAFNAVQPLETQRFKSKVDRILSLAKTEAYASGLFAGGTGFAGNLTMLALLTYGGTLVSRSEISVGDLVSLVVYSAYIGSSLIGLTSFFGTVMKGLGASSRIFELLDAKPVSVELSLGKPVPASLTPQNIVFDNVHFSYPSRPGVEILKGVNLTITPGSVVSIAGGSGSGKSTLAHLLVRYYDPSSGQVKYGDENIRDYSPESWRTRVAVVPQDPSLFSATIAENIAYGKPDATREEIEEVCRLANCWSFIQALPRGLDTQVGPRGAQMSGGQRQRLSIAQALLMNPSILVADEATSALDATSESLVNEAIAQVSKSRSLTTILIAHRLSTLKTADTVILMEDGVVAEQGTYDDLTKDQSSKFNLLVRSQLLGGGGAV